MQNDICTQTIKRGSQARFSVAAQSLNMVLYSNVNSQTSPATMKCSHKLLQLTSLYIQPQKPHPLYR